MHQIRRTSRWLGEDRGSAPIQLAILIPVLFLIAFTALQVSMLYYAHAVAVSAAQQGATAARAYNAPPGTGDQRAQNFLDAWGTKFLSDRDVRTTISGGQVSVAVTATPASILPGSWFRFTATASGPQEVFTAR